MRTTLLPTALLVNAITLVQTARAAYQLVDDFSGDAFFTGFTFFTDPDPTDGHVQFQSLEQANSSHLAGFVDGADGTKSVYLGVDATEQAPNGRRAVRVQSTKTYQHALVLADISHMPGGVCGVWPAFWMVGADWPNNGEIDIVEGVNDQASNQMTLHTNQGAVIDHETQSDTFTGELLTSNCNINAPDQSANAGCGIADTNGLTFGKNFNTNGGGTFAMEWTSDFIKIWFIPRDASDSGSVSNSTSTNSTKRKAPERRAVLSMDSPDTSILSTPNSHFTGAFSMDAHFRNLQIVFDTTFCGDWAGAVWNQSSCASLAPTCEQYVTQNPQDFTEAFWAIDSLRVFQDDGQGPSQGANDTGNNIPMPPEHAQAIRRGRNMRRSRSGGAVLPMQA